MFYTNRLIIFSIDFGQNWSKIFNSMVIRMKNILLFWISAADKNFVEGDENG